jgi:hypothetical protein
VANAAVLMRRNANRRADSLFVNTEYRRSMRGLPFVESSCGRETRPNTTRNNETIQ